MGVADTIRESLGSFLDFGRIIGSAVESTLEVFLTVRGDEDPDGDEEHLADWWGQAPLLYRPKDPDDDGQMEALFMRRDDERVVIATKDRRFVVEPAEGEVRVVALGADGERQAQVILKPDGVLVLKGVRIEIGDEGAGETIGLGTAIKNHFSSLKSWMDAHTHILTISAQSGSGGTGTAAPPSPASPSVPDVESRHKVEN